MIPAHFSTTPFATPVQNTLPNNLDNASLPDSSPTLPYNTSVQHSATTIPKPAHPCLTKTQKQYRPARPCIAERKNAMQPWIANDRGLQTRKSNTQTSTTLNCKHMFTQTSVTLDCKHIHTHKQYKDQRDPGLKNTSKIHRPARPWIANTPNQHKHLRDPGMQTHKSNTETSTILDCNTPNKKNRFSRNK